MEGRLAGLRVSALVVCACASMAGGGRGEGMGECMGDMVERGGEGEEVKCTCRRVRVCKCVYAGCVSVVPFMQDRVFRVSLVSVVGLSPPLAVSRRCATSSLTVRVIGWCTLATSARVVNKVIPCCTIAGSREYVCTQ